jgi:hypothetical protein
MTIEVYDNRKLVIGYVVAHNTLQGMDMVRKHFPNVGSVSTQSHLPSYDKRCKKISENIYSWDLTR